MTEAELRSLAFLGYWKAAHADLLNERCGCLHFDSAFQHGPANAIRLLQEACGAEVDGAWGPETEQKSRPDCFDAYMDAREKFYIDIIASDPTQKVFRNGWLNRLKHLREILA
jgi:lysozyme family protein